MQQTVFKVKQALKENNILPKKKLGQSFIISSGLAEKFADSCQITNKDTVVEVGPGLGALTLEIAKRAKQVITLEIDKNLSSLLQEKTKQLKNLEVVNLDALKYLPNIKDYLAVGNLPFSTGTAILMKFLESPNPPRAMTVILQKEVAQRITAQPPKMEKLAVFCQALSRPKIIGFIKKGSFFPIPKVDSAIIQFTDIKKPKGYKLFNEIVKSGFANPRKTLFNNLSSRLKLGKEEINQWLLRNKVDPKQRAETLSLEKWLSLARTFPQAPNC